MMIINKNPVINELDTDSLSPEDALKHAEMLLRAFEKAEVDMAADEQEMLTGALVDATNMATEVSIDSDDLEEIESVITDAGVTVEFSNGEDDDDDDDDNYPSLDKVVPMDCWASDDFVHGTSVGGVGTRKNILSVSVPRHMLTNVRTNHIYLDRLMTGSGVTPSTACLVTGIPGSGKTTLMIQTADCITGSGNVAIYNSNEESDIQISRVASRLKLKNGFEITNYESVFDIVAHARKVQEEAYREYVTRFNNMKENGATSKQLCNLRPKQVFLILDSLQTLQMPHFKYDNKTGLLELDKNGEPVKESGPAPKGDNMHLMITHYLSSTWCKRTFGSLFLIGQVTKSGEFAGKQGIKHWVDAHLHLDIDREKKSDFYQQRIAEMTKNRFGPAGICFGFEIEARGLKFSDAKQG